MQWMVDMIVNSTNHRPWERSVCVRVCGYGSLWWVHVCVCVCVCVKERERILKFTTCVPHTCTHTYAHAKAWKILPVEKSWRLGKMSRISSQGGHHAHTCTPLILIRTNEYMQIFYNNNGDGWQFLRIKFSWLFNFHKITKIKIIWPQRFGAMHVHVCSIM